MELTQKQKDEIWAYVEENESDFVEFTFKDIKKLREQTRKEFLENRKVIDEVFYYNEVSC